MKRTGDNTIELTEEELVNIFNFIRATLYCEWDQYTNNFITSKSKEEGMRSMNPEMYDFAAAIDQI